jgi:ABC-type glycerol-3-phosphate transport system permease component
VIIPISWPSIITASLFALLGAYNAFLLPRLLTQTKWTLSVAIAQYTSAETAQAILQADAAAVSVTLPIVIVIIFFQKYLVKGLASGAVKG